MSATTPTTKRGIADALAEKSEALESILDRGDEISVEDLTNAKGLSAECQALKAALDQFGETERFRGDLVTLKSFLSTPKRPALPSGSAGDGATVVGAVPAGQVEIGLYGSSRAVKAGDRLVDVSDRKVLIDRGPGHFGRKAWDAITHDEYSDAFWTHVRTGDRSAFKDLQLGLDDQGGILAPAEFIARIISRLPAPTQLLGQVSRFATGRDKVLLPRVQYADSLEQYDTGFRPVRSGELPATSTVHKVTDTSLFGVFKIDIDTWMMSLPLTRDVIEDAAFPLEQWVADKFRTAVELTYENQIINGTGQLSPDGIMNRLGSTDKPPVVLSGSSGALSYNGIQDIWTDLAPQYDQNARFLMSKKGGYRALTKLVDGNSRPLFSRGAMDYGMVEDRRQLTIEGYPVLLSQFMPQTVSSSTYPIAFGDFRGYYHVDRVGFSILVLREVAALQNEVILVGRMRFGGGVAEPWRLRIQKSHNA